MPEKSKRRKNNKNKRKNKNNRSDGNRNTNSDVKDLGSVESGSVQSLECQENNETSELQSSVENVSETVQPCTGDLTTKEESNLPDECCDHSFQQDLNNNSENSELCDAIVLTENAEIPDSENYIVESPEQSLKSKPKLSKNNIKSKSLDNDDETKIVEITEDSGHQCENDNTMAVIDSNILVSDVESDIEWEKIDEDSSTEPKEIATGTLSVTTIPLNVAQCEHTKSLTPDEEISLRHYLKTLNLSTHPNVNAIEIKTEIEQIINREIRQRLRKKGLADDFVPSRLGPPRILDVIDEEGSSESSVTSRRQSYLSDKKSDNEELEDDVFEEPPKVIKSQSSKFNTTIKRSHKMIGQLVPQECVLVGAKIKEPEVAEARGDWTMQTVEEMKGAEVVYLTDSSSTSSIHEIGDDTDNGEDTDVSVRMITPTIEVTDTDKLLKNTFISESKTNDIQQEQLKNPVKNSDSGEGILTNSKTQPENNDLNNLETEKNHEIIVSSIDDIKTNLYVKDVEENSKESVTTSEQSSNQPRDKNVAKTNDEYDLEMKVLKCELNDAINNLIKEVCSDSENNENLNNNFVRQDSSSSVGSSSQCTAKYNPTHSSLNDVSNILHDELTGPKLSRENSKENSHVKDVFECVTGTPAHNTDETNNKSIEPSALRDICVRRISTLPYGDKILEELASVSERLQNINSFGRKGSHNSDTLTDQNNTERMPYFPLPDVSAIEKVSLPVHQKKPQPPPVQPRNSSLKKSQDDNHWTGVPTEVEPVYVCFSPSQKMLMEKTNTVITKEDATQLADMHKKYVDRRGYNEPNHVKKYDINDTENPPIVPFKSQTGSRLLALIRDPTVTSNVNSNSRVNSRYTSSYENIKKSNYSSEYISKMKDNSSFGSLSTNFKPIPPPRPKKYSSSFYESDESSDFTDSSMRSIRSEKKSFHFSTGNLSKDIENDISSIQNMHRYYTNTRDNLSDNNRPRRPSLPKDLCDQQMEYIRKKEKEVEAEIKRLEQEKLNMSVTHKTGPRAPLIIEKETISEKHVDDNHVYASRKNDVSVNTQSSEKLNRSKLSSVFSSSQEELLRDKMYSEYVTQMAERQERKQHKIIKITNPSPASNKTVSKSMPALEILDSKVNNRIEEEFISKARERWNKLGIADPETEDERDKDVYREPKVIEHKIKVIEGGAETDVKKLPSHLQEFVSFTAKQKEQGASSSGESGSGSASPHVVIWCAVIILVLAVGKYFLRLLRNE
ncbi:hypothetical protein ABMA27_000814 [Loxostege sticticalis]|uniref:Uncharacterized protein n=1 Tax=Loxostege sticticalis TaxID=481309 RepID=A0ABR3I0E2_LOXSC